MSPFALLVAALAADAMDVTIRSAAGWYTTICYRSEMPDYLCPVVVGVEEIRVIDGSTFHCYAAGLLDHMDQNGASGWRSHNLSHSSKVFYTSTQSSAATLGPTGVLADLVNDTFPYLRDKRVCAPASAWRANVTPHFNCSVHGANATDCPDGCLVPASAASCAVNFEDEACYMDKRCIPEPSLYEPNSLGEGQIRVQGKCLASNRSTITIETCDNSKASQRWIFEAQRAVAV